MIGVVIVAHGSFGEEILNTVEMIIGKQDQVDVIDVLVGVNLAEVSEKLQKSIAKYRKNGCLIFTDMFGGSPSNVAIGYLEKGIVEVISSINVPMLLKAFSMRMYEDVDLEKLSSVCAGVGKSSIKIAGEILDEKDHIQSG